MDPIASTTSQPVIPAKPETIAADTPGTNAQTPTSATKTTETPAAVVDLSPAARQVIDLGVRDMTEAEKVYFEKLKADYRAHGWDDTKLNSWGGGTDWKVVEADGRIHEYHADAPQMSAEEIARRREEYAQKERENQALKAAQAEWDAKWGKDQPVSTGPLTREESAVASAAAGIESALSSIREMASSIRALGSLVPMAESRIEHASVYAADAEGQAKLKVEYTAYIAETLADIARLEDSLATAIDRFQKSYQVQGNLLKKDEGGLYREGSYSFAVGGAGWSIQVSSKDGIMASIGDQPYTHDFKRTKAVEPGPALLDVPAIFAAVRQVDVTT